MKKTIFLFLLMVLSFPFCASADNYVRGDVDHDGNVGIADVAGLIDYLLMGTWNEDYHEYVDLGLPSGTLWATMNIGAFAPYDYGDYFAWGETGPKPSYEWATYKWCNGSSESLTKYCTDSDYGTVDNKTELELEDDAAYVNWGPSWRTPTAEQMQELIDNCDWLNCTIHGVWCQVITGPNGNTMILPVAGYRNDAAYVGASSMCDYWLRTLNSDSRPDLARSLHTIDTYISCVTDARYKGCSVRAVRVPQE